MKVLSLMAERMKIRLGWEVCWCSGVEPGCGEGGSGQDGRCLDVQVLGLMVEKVGQGRLGVVRLLTC